MGASETSGELLNGPGDFLGAPDSSRMHLRSCEELTGALEKSRKLLKRPGSSYRSRGLWSVPDARGALWKFMERFGSSRSAVGACAALLKFMERAGCPWSARGTLWARIERFRRPWSALDVRGALWKLMERSGS